MGWSTREMLKGQVEANYDLKKIPVWNCQNYLKRKRTWSWERNVEGGISGNLKGRKMCGYDQNVRNSQAIKKQKILW